MQFQSSGDFEQAVLDCRSDGEQLVQRFWGERADFSEDVIDLLNQPGPEYPDTRIGKSLFCMIKEELDRCGINTEGFTIRSGINTKVDARHWGDAVGRIPSIPKLPFTIDLFNISPSDVSALEEIWVGMSEKPDYSRCDFQSDLFQYNKGLFAWMKENNIPRGVFICLSFGKHRKKTYELPERGVLVPLIDFRKYSDRGRPENHFILTPYDVETSQRRKKFAEMVAGYFVKATKSLGRQKTALLSH